MSIGTLAKAAVALPTMADSTAPAAAAAATPSVV